MAAALLSSGCLLTEVRSKTKVGPEFRHDGGCRSEEERWTAQQGVEFKWDNGVNTGLTYRRRDVNDGGGDHDDGVWMEVSFPIWMAKKKPDWSSARLAELEERVADLERRLSREEDHES
jgi:hypothetical protein